jgi:release factor glutamine methyltransferase
MVTEEHALLELLTHLKSHGYQFTCVTPATHERVLARPDNGERSLRDIFGWNRTFKVDDLAPDLLNLLHRANCIQESGEHLRSSIRVASVSGHLFLHSSYPTSSPDAVFLGPDTYRFIKFVRERLPASEGPRRIVDMGAGSGAAGILTAKREPSARTTLLDINPAAAQLARVNAKFAQVETEIIVSDELAPHCDVVIANPPFLKDAFHRTYRDGGSMFGGQVALQWVKQALTALVPGGKMLLYTGAAFIRGQSPLLDHVVSLCSAANAKLLVEEIDPDIFGEELSTPDYCQVERIAAVGISIESAA